jgi:hypothetical protein
MVQNKVTNSDDIVSLLDYVDENFSEVIVIMKLVKINNLTAKVAHQTANKVMGK